MKQAQIDFIKSIQHIGTSKFTTETYKENIEWKKNNNKINYTITTLVNPICDRIQTDAGVYILEMNNQTNQIEGIGIIKNHPFRCDTVGVKIYDNDYYNMYFYYGSCNISREEIVKNEANIKPLKYLENLVFKGSTHLKRGWNYSCFSLKKERIAVSPPYDDFIFQNNEWTWKNKNKDIRRCSVCYRKKNTAHKYFYDIHKKCTLTPIFSYKKSRCDSCGEFKRGHICVNIKKKPENIYIVFKFLRSLFIYT